MNNYSVQKVRTCIATYFNLYGKMPGIQEIADWSGESYEMVLQIFEAGMTGPETAAA